MFLLAAANAYQRRYGNSNSADSVSLRQLGDFVVQSPVYYEASWPKKIQKPLFYFIQIFGF
jgi:hypothetical protein